MSRAISVTVARGSVVESRHTIHAVAATKEGVVSVAGDGSLVAFLRSAAKPIQALPLVRDVPDLREEEIAIACGSHEARDEQLTWVRSLLARAGASSEDLACGVAEGPPVEHECSGKHAGMMTLARARELPLQHYWSSEHPIQDEILGLMGEAAGVPPSKITTAIDGCGVPTFALSLTDMARMFARFMDGEFESADRIRAAMLAHPDLVGGPAASDTAAMLARPGLLAKRGAEGLLCVGLPEGVGVALKVEDGAMRAALPGLGRFLEIGELEEAALSNSRGEPIGFIKSEPAAGV